MKQKTLDFLEAHKSEQPSTFTEDAKWRQENEVWLKQKENSEFRAWRRQWRKVSVSLAHRAIFPSVLRGVPRPE